MPAPFPLKPPIQLGVVPTHLGFIDALVPAKDGRLPRHPDGRLVTTAGLSALRDVSPVPLSVVQVPCFPGVHADDLAELVRDLRGLDFEVQFVLMLGGVNPIDPADEDAVLDQLVPTLAAAVHHGVRHVASTSIEGWMDAGEQRREGRAFQAAIEQNVKLHLRAIREAGLDGSSVESWHMEFLRPGEFQTFTDLGRGWAFVQAANAALGRRFFKQLVDAAHCGDSGLTIQENADLLSLVGEAGELGIFHASAKTTRGCLSTDDGWCGALLAAAARTGELRYVMVEAFRHDDPALAPLRALDPNHGIDTTDGRTYTDLIADAIGDVARRLNNLAARGILPSA